MDRIVIAWKDTREARRAALDALPLLKAADHIAIVGIAPKEELASVRAQLKDVAGWLKGRGIVAECQASPTSGDDADVLHRTAQEQRADVIVAGAYGHSRFREWALGGVGHHQWS